MRSQNQDLNQTLGAGSSSQVAKPPAKVAYGDNEADEEGEIEK